MNKNSVILLLLLVGTILFSWMQFSYLPSLEKQKEAEERKQLDPLTHDFSKVMKYKNPYMGNNWNNSNLFQNLPPMSNGSWTYALDPESFQITLNFDSKFDEMDRTIFEMTMLYNTTAAFALIDNLEIIELSFPDHNIIVTRDRVVEWFGEDVRTFSNENTFTEKVQLPLREKSELDEWVRTYEGGEQ